MAKGWIIPAYFLYLLLISLVAESILFSTNNGEIVMGALTITEDVSLLFVWDILRFIFGMFTFQVVGVPALVNLILFWLPTLGAITVYIIPTIRGN